MTVSGLFNMAMDLLGERKKDGSFSSNTEYLTARAVTAVNQVLVELAPAQAKLTGLPLTITPITALTDTVVLDNRLMYTAGPLGICAALMLGEDDDRYAAFRLIYENSIKTALRSVKAIVGAIVDIYS
ncbi:MAG: hypothetical protein A2Y17_08060 [Clostridiales bacterium GWF2_38_85]|nr:MAG: hypothetical protein A2Y17_08060 [Clostridiales bacterium GWF2_38_85]HBL83854.1 hypothetical protein [Clostridiales bacterium]